ncbi:unnamed protein product, partial [Vitis vinifera]
MNRQLLPFHGQKNELGDKFFWELVGAIDIVPSCCDFWMVLDQTISDMGSDETSSASYKNVSRNIWSRSRRHPSFLSSFLQYGHEISEGKQTSIQYTRRSKEEEKKEQEDIKVYQSSTIH